MTAVGTGIQRSRCQLDPFWHCKPDLTAACSLAILALDRIRGEGTNVRGPGPDGVTRGAMGHENYAFTGPANTVGTGATVPVIYGRVIAGSHLLAANLVVSDNSDPLKITTRAPGLQTFRNQW